MNIETDRKYKVINRRHEYFETPDVWRFFRL